MTDQSHVDAITAALTQAATDIKAEVAELKSVQTTPSLDFSKLDAVVARLKGDDPTSSSTAPTTA